MRFHHMCIVTTDLARAISFWRDFMGFALDIEIELPDGAIPGPETFCDAGMLETAFASRGARSRMALLSSSDGAMIELQQPLSPPAERTPEAQLTYRRTGIRELGLAVVDIDAWFAKAKAAGYRTQTDDVWSSANIGRSFILFDHESNMIQLWEDADRGVGWLAD